MRLHRFIGLATVVLATAGTALGQATSAFTYQGRLTSSGAPQNGNFDFKFALWSDPAAGAQIGSTLTVSALPVSAGLFSTQLDFGRVFDSSRLWLQIQVRPAGGGSFTPLSPRQELTAAPYANGLSLPTSGLVNTSSVGLSIQNLSGPGIYGTGGTSGDGIDGFSYAPAGNGVYGDCSTNTGSYGVWGVSSTGYGVVGDAFGSAIAGGWFGAQSGSGVIGAHLNPTGANPGVEGDSASTDASANAVVGHLSTTTPGGYSSGVRGICDGASVNGIGVYGSHAGGGCGVYGLTATGGYGVVGTAGTGFGGIGVYGTSDIGVYGAGVSSCGVFGYTLANSTSLAGVNGYGQTAIRGDSGSGGSSSFGVYGASTAPGGNGVRGDASGSGAYGVWGVGNSGAYAGVFNGPVSVVGSLSKSGGSFKIDHPLDPANKFLYHSFVESPDMMNVYNGNVTTDTNGNATVTMPEWFQTLNRDFRYQLTVIGGGSTAKDRFPQVLILRKIDASNSFTIASSSGGVEVSWQVTGVRQDAWANAHRIPVEQDKSELERGRYLHPELFGQSEELSINGWKGKPEAAAPMTPELLPARQGGMSAAPAPAAVPAVPHKTPPQPAANDTSAPVSEAEMDN